MGKFFEKNLVIILPSTLSYFLFSISTSLKKSTKYDSDIRAFAKMKAFFNDKKSFKLYQKEAYAIAGLEVKFIGEYCKKLTQHNIF